MKNYGLRQEVNKQLIKLNALFRKQFKKDIPITEGYRSDEDQKYLYDQAVKQYGPIEAGIWVAPPGTSRHRHGTEIDLSMDAMTDEEKRWISHNAQTLGFKNRYSWEPWHYGMDVNNPQPLTPPSPIVAQTPVALPIEQSKAQMTQVPKFDFDSLKNPFRSYIDEENTEETLPGMLPSPSPIAKYPVPYNTNPNNILLDAIRGIV
jgi:hypothetical protein